MGIELMDLSKKFGQKKAVDGLTLNIEGGMYGLLGPNGAGKTTLMRMLCTLLLPTGGSARLNGVPIADKRAIRRLVGYLPQDFSFYPGFTVYETLDYLGLLSDMKDAKKRAARIDELLILTNLVKNRKTKVRGLSGGMLRRLGIAQVLLNDPHVIIVDEPTAGLDPEERIRFRNLLGSLSQGKTVLLSTHIAEDIAQTCPNAAVMDQGRLLYAGTVSALTESARGHVWRASIPNEELSAVKARHTLAAMMPTPDGFEVRLVSQDAPFAGATPAEPGLEDAYLLLVKGGTQHATDWV